MYLPIEKHDCLRFVVPIRVLGEEVLEIGVILVSCCKVDQQAVVRRKVYYPSS